MGDFTEGVIFLIFKLLRMNELELKAVLHERIVGIQTIKYFQRVLDAIDEIQGEEEDCWAELSDEKRECLEKAIAHSRIPANRIPHEKMKL